MSSFVEVEGLTKRFGQLTAIENVHFRVSQGEIMGLLGPNGAGKTTTMKCLLTLIKPTSGTARICGVDILKHPQRVRELCGYVPQGVSVDGDLTAYENLLFYAKLFFVPSEWRRQRIQEILDYMQLADRSDDLVKNFSGGMMRRLEVGQALLNRPKALFLDEPSIGLDPAAKRAIWDYIVRLRDELGAAILITTHDMHEADHLCDRIAIMNSGRIVAIGSPAQLKAQLGGDVLSITSSTPHLAEVLRQMGYQLLTTSQNDSVELVVNDGERAIPRVLEMLRSQGIVTEAVSLKRATLDDVFLKYAGKRIDESDVGWHETRATRRTIRRLTR